MNKCLKTSNLKPCLVQHEQGLTFTRASYSNADQCPWFISFKINQENGRLYPSGLGREQEYLERNEGYANEET